MFSAMSRLAKLFLVSIAKPDKSKTGLAIMYEEQSLLK